MSEGRKSAQIRLKVEYVTIDSAICCSTLIYSTELSDIKYGFRGTFALLYNRSELGSDLKISARKLTRVQCLPP